MAALGVHCLPFPLFVKMKEGTEKGLIESCVEKTAGRLEKGL
jgi:hypothetical protein